MSEHGGIARPMKLSEVPLFMKDLNKCEKCGFLKHIWLPKRKTFGYSCPALICEVKLSEK